MSENHSSPSDDSLAEPQHLFVINGSDINCLVSGPTSFVFVTYNITSILLLLPLCILILYHGLQQWRKKRSTSSQSHSDWFIYNMVTMELVSVLGCVISCFGVYREDSDIVHVGETLLFFTLYGESFFHLLTCVERYLAVVHPITYLSLRGGRGIRIRNTTAACVWLFCFSTLGLERIEHVIVTIDFSVNVFALLGVSFCSLSVLRVLIRPGPGEQGGDRERVDQLKQRAFYTIMAILGALVLRFSSRLLSMIDYVTSGRRCEMLMSAFLLSLPSSLVLPLLFVHREGKAVCWRNTIQ